MREPETMRLLAKNEPLIRYREDEQVFESLHSYEKHKGLSGQLSNRRLRKPITDCQSRSLRELFEELDVSGTGRVRQKGIAHTDFLNELISRRLASGMLKKIIPFSMEMKSYSELMEVIKPVTVHLRTKAMRHLTVKRKMLPQGKVEEYRRLFQLLDINCNGSLDVDELRKGFEYHSSSEVMRLMSQYDFDENKELQFYEFLRMVAPEEYAIPQDIEDEYKLSSPKYTVK